MPKVGADAMLRCWGGNYTRTPRNVSALEYDLEACHLEPNNVASVDEITEGPAETGVGVYSERALRCKTNTLCSRVRVWGKADEYPCKCTSLDLTWLTWPLEIY